MSTENVLPPELTIFTVTECRALYLEWLDGEAPSASADRMSLDASSVVEVDGAGIQLLVSLERSLASRGKALKLCGAGPSLSAACNDLGVADLLDNAPSTECPS